MSKTEWSIAALIFISLVVLIVVPSFGESKTTIINNKVKSMQYNLMCRTNTYDNNYISLRKGYYSVKGEFVGHHVYGNESFMQVKSCQPTI